MLALSHLLGGGGGGGGSVHPDRSASALGAAMLAGHACGIAVPPLQPDGPQYAPDADRVPRAAYELRLARLG